METINERFRQLRKSTGLSQEEFAQKARRTRSEIKNIEYDKTEPKDEVIKSVCDAHGVNEVWLRTGAGEMYTPRTREEEIAELVGQALTGTSDFKLAVVKMICSRSDKELEVLEAALRSIYESL